MPKILLVDDSSVDRALFTTLLENENFDVESCPDGISALKAMAQSLPDIVLTDMQMPEMDGLELVKEVRLRFADTPVVLITGHGSEELATKALRAGAAGYVPKSNSSELLTTTIQHVLTLSTNRDIDPRLREHTASIQYELKLPNDETLIPAALQLIRQRIGDAADVDPVTLLQIGVALEHAIVNAIYHGNLDFAQHAGIDFDEESRVREAKILNAKQPYCDRVVTIALRISANEARFSVKDEGRGFDVKEVSSLGLSQSLRGEFGQGLFLMWAFMDKVVFDKSGTGVTMLKRLELPIVEVNDTEVREAEGSGTDAPPTQAQPAAEERVPLLTLHHQASDMAYPVFKERVTIGRDPSCDVVIEGSAISFHHCLLFLHEGWWFVRDLKSKNGIKVNGAQCDSNLLPPKAILSLGSMDFAAEYLPHKLGGVGITPPPSPF